MYIAKGCVYDETSEVNRRIMQLFVAREVRHDMSEIVEYILDTGTPQNCPPFTFEDISSEHSVCCPECGEEAQFDMVVLQPSDIVAERVPDADPMEGYRCPICGITYADPNDAQECCVGVEAFRCGSCGHIISIDEYGEREDTGPAIQSWWAVTPWLCEQLAALGETVIRSENLWGRPSKEPNFSQDPVIFEICRDLGILEGQRHDWSRNFIGTHNEKDS